MRRLSAFLHRFWMMHMTRVLSAAAAVLAVLVFTVPMARAQSVCEYTGKFPPSCSGRAPQTTPDLAYSRIEPMTIDPATITTDTLLPAFRQVFRVHACQLSLSGGERTFAETLSQVLSVPADALQDRDGPWYRPIDTAFDQLQERGVVEIDRSAGVIRFPDCAS